jgi:hypothetical protein
MKKNLFLAGLVAGLIVLLPQGNASAAAKCDLSAQANALAEARKKNDGTSAGVKAELAVRKTVLKDTIDCSIQEVKTLQASVKALDPKDKEIVTVRDRFAARLQDAIDHYADLGPKIDDLGLKGSKDMARSLIDWRNGSYLPIADEAGNVVIWTRNQPLFDTAQNRLNQIGQNLRTLKLFESDDVKALYEKSQANLEKAVELNKIARAALIEDLPVEETTPKIKASLEGLSATYKSFLGLSDAAKKLLPL